MTILTQIVRSALAGAVSNAPNTQQQQARNNIQKLFVANVPWTVSNRELKLYFSKYGHVANATIVFDKQCGMSRGFGFVQYSNRSGYNAAVNEAVHALEGRALIVQPASSNNS